MNCRELRVEQPLQPLVERDAIGVRLHESIDARRVRAPVLVGPRLPRAAVVLGERAENRVLAQARALGAVSLERLRAGKAETEW